MFTGIVQERGIMTRIQHVSGLVCLSIQAPKTAARVQRMESVAVNGVCLSVVDVRQREVLVFEVIRETQRLTNLGVLRTGDPVNLEPSLSVTDRLSGHIVFGHVDGLGTVVSCKQLGGEWALTVRVAPSLRALIVPKGPIVMDGVSLTVGQRVGASIFSVHLIPETLRQTTLAHRRVGDRVNIELDYFAKLIRQFLVSRR